MLDPTLTPRQFIFELKLNKCGLPEAGGMEIAKAIMQGNHVSWYRV